MQDEHVSNQLLGHDGMTEFPAATSDDPLKKALVLDEKSVDYFLADPSTKHMLLTVARSCDTVLACRARKDQKAKLVQLIREGVKDKVTLAIGDGANDVEMIFSAHVGIGIFGKEGMQACNAADYVLAQFRFLKRLLLVHGRSNYMRMSVLIPYMFYKDILLVAAQLVFQMFCQWSGQIVYPQAGLTWYNTIVTAFAIFYVGIFDRDVPPQFVERYPELYRRGVDHKHFTTWLFWGWQLEALLMAVALVFVQAMCVETSGYLGSSVPLWDFATLLYTNVVLLVSLRLTFEIHVFHWLYFFLLLGLNLLFWFSYSWVLNFMTPIASDPTPISGTMQTLFTDPGMVISSVLVLSILVCYVTLHKALQRRLRPTLSQLVQEVAVGADPDPLDAALAALAAPGKAAGGGPSGRWANESESVSTAFDDAHTTHSFLSTESKTVAYI